MAAHTAPLPPVLAGTTWTSPTWAVLLGGAPVDLDHTSTTGWAVTATAVDPRTGATVVDFTAAGAAMILGRTRTTGGARTGTVALHLSPARTARLTADGERTLRLHVHLHHPSAGRDGGAYRRRLVDAALLVLDHTPAGAP